jgi:FixJ family two-component response regulator
VIDQKMPEMTGLDLLARLRTIGIVLPAILITGAPSAALHARARQAGIPLIEKPLFGDALPDAIRAALGIAY